MTGVSNLGVAYCGCDRRWIRVAYGKRAGVPPPAAFLDRKTKIINSGSPGEANYVGRSFPSFYIMRYAATRRIFSTRMALLDERTIYHSDSTKIDAPLACDLVQGNLMVQCISLTERKVNDTEFAALIRVLGRDKMPTVASYLFCEMRSKGLMPGRATLSALMLCYAENGLLPHAQALWSEIINSSFVPNLEVVSDLMDVYSRMGQFGEVIRIIHETISRDVSFGPKIYSLAVSCFGKAGQLELMEDTIREMVSRGLMVDSLTGNAFVTYYSMFGSISDMEMAYERLKRSRILIEKEALRAMATTYIKERKYYKLGEFLRDVGLGRRNSGNLLWNLLLLSYAANFKMKSLQREFLRMVEAGFSPDLTTFNIRALAFSRMSMFWDLHLSIEHMRCKSVIPDLVTYGCIVDAYFSRRLGRNLSYALNNMNMESTPLVSTDPLVFEVLGKGDFHSSSEVLLESRKQRGLTYSKLVAVYIKKQYRSNQIFWNY